MNSRWLQAGLAGLLAAAVGFGAWLSIPSPTDRFSPAQLERNRRFLFWPRPDRVAGNITFDGGAVRLAPGAHLDFDLAGRAALLQGSFQATSDRPATAELVLVGAAGERRVLLRRALDGAAAGRRFFLVDPTELPAGTRSLALSVPADSPGGIDWREVEPLPRAGNALLQALPLPLIAYEGFTAPGGDAAIVLTHAPSQFRLALPAGSRLFEFGFGYNLEVFKQPGNYSDGIVFKVRLESPAGMHDLWEHALDPRVRPGDRELQAGTVALAPPVPAQLLLVIEPGPTGNTAWDWAQWRDLRVTPRP
jgi:hypothetical protein